MSTPIDITPLRLVLTEQALIDLGLQPFYAGDDWRLRFSVRDAAGAPIALTGATVVLRIDGTAVKRTTDVVITGAVKQIAHDADQTAENVSDPTNPTGKSWFTVNAHHSEKATFEAIAGARRIGIDITWGSGDVVEFARGVLEITKQIKE